MNLELREKISKIWRGCNEKEAINQILALIGKCGGKEVNYFRILEICKGAISDAIYCEDGLDGSTGESIIEDIDELLKSNPVTCLECDHLIKENLKLGEENKKLKEATPTFSGGVKTPEEVAEDLISKLPNSYLYTEQKDANVLLSNTPLQRCSICGKDQPLVCQTNVCLTCMKLKAGEQKEYVDDFGNTIEDIIKKSDWELIRIIADRVYRDSRHINKES